MPAAVQRVNQDLENERAKCTFDVKELTLIIDGGKEAYDERKEIENKVLRIPEIYDDVPEEFLSHKERYENAVRKSVALSGQLADRAMSITSLEDFSPSNAYRVLYTVTKDVSPFLLHWGMFVPSILGQASADQMAEWLPKALSMQMIGTYAQTELGHGTFLRGLETTATYDARTEHFIIHSPTLTSFKWWPGGLGYTANHCIVMARLIIDGKEKGVYPFLVQIRDMDTHMPMPGVKVGEIGPKLGYNTANNGFLGFDHYRIPRTNMLMKNAQVHKDGTFERSVSDKLSYGTMMLIRVMIVSDVAFELSRAATIATRYSAVRHQSKVKESEPEVQILDYVTQQHKLFIAIASSHALRITGKWLWASYSQVVAGDLSQLPELHATASCLKAISSYDAARLVEQCRLACGGHGFMASSNLPIIYGLATAAVTYEGEYTVMLLQTARSLMKTWRLVLDNKPLAVTVAYMASSLKKQPKWQNTPEGIIAGMQAVAAGKTREAYENIQRHQKAGKDYEDAWNLSSVLLTQASEAHCRAIICSVFWAETQRLGRTASTPLASVLAQLAELYLTYWAIERAGHLLVYSNLSKSDLIVLQRRYEVLLSLIRPNAVGLVDAFDLRDEILNSTLGAWDGRVYERLMEEALKSPLNKEPVNQSFHKYIKPMMQGKL